MIQYMHTNDSYTTILILTANVNTSLFLCYKANVFSCLFPFLLSVCPVSPLPRSSLCVAQMNRPIQVKPADSESRGGRFPLLFFLLPFLFLSPPSCHSTSVSPLPVDVPFLRVIYNDAPRWDPTVIQGPRGSWAGPYTSYISVVTPFVWLISSTEVLGEPLSWVWEFWCIHSLDIFAWACTVVGKSKKNQQFVEFYSKCKGS